MAMSPSGLKAKLKARIHDGLKAQFGGDAAKGKGYLPIADAQWEKMAEAISGIAADIVTEITANAEVVPGIPVSPATFTTTSPGKIS